MNKTIKTNRRGAHHAIIRRWNFKASALSGRIVRPGDVYLSGYGHLPAEHIETFQADLRVSREYGREMFVVYSYVTPIGWAVGDNVTIPDVKYSVTTSRHQSIARHGLTSPRTAELVSA
jgi:hypothetical protein